jgi:hypothetical protein
MRIKNDIPGRIARWLFTLGFFWAGIAVVPTILSLGSLLDKGASLWRLAVYLLIGYGVWAGWLWRSRQARTLRVSAALWLFSAAWNSLFVFLLSTASQEPKILFFEGDSLFLWWWIAATIASLVAFILEFSFERESPSIQSAH